jgi:hypothetical protein
MSPTLMGPHHTPRPDVHNNIANMRVSRVQKSRGGVDARLCGNDQMGVEGGERCSGVAVLDGETSHREKLQKWSLDGVHP